MSESSLSPSYDDIAPEVGHVLGFTRDSLNWDTEQTADVEAVIKAGYHKSLFPPILPGEKKSHEWSFLKPLDTITFVPGTYVYTLEDDCGGIEGNLTYDSDSEGRVEVRVIPEVQIREKRQAGGGDLRMPPRFAAIRPKEPTHTTGQRFELVVFPTPATADVVTFKKILLVPKLETGKYPIGGLQFGYTVMQSCLAVADQRINDTRGNHKAEFIESLTASVSADRSIQAPEFYGTDTGGSKTCVRAHRVVSFTQNGVAI